MSIYVPKNSRRQFLVGTGNTLLALPVLPSLLPMLLPSEVRAAGALAAANKRMMMLNFIHCVPSSHFLDIALATTPVGTDGVKQVLLSTLGTPMSSVLTHSFYETLRLAGKVTILRGHDNIVDFGGHGTRNLSAASNYSDPARLKDYPSGMFPSIDSVMEASPTLYPTATTATNVTKAIRLDFSDTSTNSYKKVGTQVVENTGFPDPLKMYAAVFASLTSGGGSTPVADPLLTLKKKVLDQVFASYTSVRSSRKISSEDKLRLDEHLQFVGDVQRKINASIVPAGLSCTKPTQPVWNGSYKDSVTIGFGLLALAFKCGLTKVGKLDTSGHVALDIPGLPNDAFHNGIVHNINGAYTTAQILNYWKIWQKFHFDAMADGLLAPLNIEEDGSGRTYLDNMLTVTNYEGGVAATPDPHTTTDFITLMFGTMGGYIKADRMLNLRAKNHPSSGKPLGIPQNQVLITLLQAMGVPAAEYEAIGGGKGFGPYNYNDVAYKDLYGARFYSPIAEVLA